MKPTILLTSLMLLAVHGQTNNPHGSTNGIGVSGLMVTNASVGPEAFLIQNRTKTVFTYNALHWQRTTNWTTVSKTHPVAQTGNVVHAINTFPVLNQVGTISDVGSVVFWYSGTAHTNAVATNPSHLPQITRTIPEQP